MRRHRRLVGWWLAAWVTAASARNVHAQSTASFPEDSGNKRPAPPAAAPNPKPSPAAPKAAPAAPARPPATPSAAPAPPAPPVTSPPSGPSSVQAGDARPPLLPYREGLPVPNGYQVVSGPATGLITGGIVGMATSYGLGIIVGATQGFRNGLGFVAVPIAGPWLAIGTRNYECEGSTSTVADAKKCVNAAVGEVQLITFLAVDGIAQLASGFITIAGLMSTKQELIRTDLLPAQVSVVPPGPGRDGWGISARGEF